MNTTDVAGPYGSPLTKQLTKQLGPLVEAAGMVNFLNHGAASHVSSEGCHGVTQEHLERFSALLLAAERERWKAHADAMAQALEVFEAQGSDKTSALRAYQAFRA